MNRGGVENTEKTARELALGSMATRRLAQRTQKDAENQQAWSFRVFRRFLREHIWGASLSPLIPAISFRTLRVSAVKNS